MKLSKTADIEKFKLIDREYSQTLSKTMPDVKNRLVSLEKIELAKLNGYQFVVTKEGECLKRGDSFLMGKK